MATQVLIAHTGQRLEVDTAQFSRCEPSGQSSEFPPDPFYTGTDADARRSLDDLKAWVARNSSVSLQHMVALTPQGRTVKYASLHAEKEIYIYDIRVTQQQSSSTVASPSLVSEAPAPRRLSIPIAPNSIDDVQAIASWQHLYEERRNWAVRLTEECSRLNDAAAARYDEMDVMIKCLDAAVANLELSVKQIEPKYNELKKWVEPALAEHEQLAASWEQYLTLARKTPVSPAMVKFMTRGEVTKTNVTLEDLVELETARKAGKLAATARRRFSDKATELDRMATQMYRGLEGLASDFDKLMSRSALAHSTDAAHLFQDIEAVASQIDSDYKTALGYAGSQRDLAQASKTASNHTERLVPSLRKRAKEMDEIVQYATDARNAIARESVIHMRTTTDVTALYSSVRNQINVLNQSEDDLTTFDYLRLIHQLPYMYASFAVEAIRRREWVDKVKTDSSTLANEMALFQDEESKRRRRWQKMVGSMYGPSSETNVVGLEVNLLGEDVPWPALTKDDLDAFLHHLQESDVDPAVLEDVSKLIQELNSPTKQQSKRLKAFKNGSVHEAALGRSGLLIRGDDELLRTLQDDKTKLESKLKTAESRVRRLEDLLHRQSQTSRPGNLFQPQRNQPHERQDSTSSIRSGRPDDRRMSSEGIDPLLRKITQLEHELHEEKQRSAQFEKELNTRSTQHNDMKYQIQEVNSTKKDLLENMEALKREFLDERKSLEDEIKTLKARLEDTEDEIEHFGESRENEKATYDEKVHALEAEVERLTREHGDDVLKAQGQVEFLRKEAQMQRERLEASERQVQVAAEENRSVSSELETARETIESQDQALRKLHDDLAPDASAPVDLLDLTDSLQSYATGLLTKLRNAESDLAVARADLEQASNSVKESKTDIANARSKLAVEEEEAMRLRETLAEEKAKVTALEGEVAEGREQLSRLRTQLSDGASGSETLQKKLEDEEKKVARQAEELASRQSQVGSLEEELHMFKQRVEDVQSKMGAMSAHYEARDGRTKGLSQRLYSQNDRLTRLLERIGYSVTRQDGEMTINKIPRSERSTQNPNDSSDPGSTLRRSASLGIRQMTDSGDLEPLYWMDGSDDSTEAEKYERFMQTLGYFDLDLFSETVYLRIKEAEHKARKWQREARGYRDRAHAAQKDAHDKIAFRHFKEGDLALFLPTRNQQAGAWAAFNVGFPHYFLREQDAHRLRHREWLVARISRVQERVVDLSKSLQPANDAESVNDDENDNPFQLSDGLRWYLIDAHEDKPGAPSTPGMGKSTVAANTVEATADIQLHAGKGKGKNRDSVASIEGINKTLSKSLDSRRSSSNSKKALPFAIGGGAGTALLKNSALASETNSLRAAPTDTPAGTSPAQASLLSASLANPAEQLGPAPRSVPGESSAQGSPAAKSPEPRVPLQREESVESPSKKSVLWDSLWSVDYSYESPSKRA
ncbi:oligomeric, coiled-coil, peripheral membrane protein [Purpureocillium lilacinum]|uniref:oligomeric, coiled-coil, peripheral membrane protein n=1 Tax=Purpureocillium lilacinum TaxID=33203 RepID=UPI00208654A8|nr:oligomeric, coiled-coil, peripheral membrane protein [Purpureocillium lilacinum]